VSLPERKQKESTGVTGLRDRKKAKRRGDILRQARTRFAAKGIDATTMDEIAGAVGVSTPTIFNYFGNKDGILIALITEGSTRVQEEIAAGAGAARPREGTDFTTLLVDLFTFISQRTLDIASKRVWRYAEAAAIRHPKTALAREYAEVDERLRDLVASFLAHYEIRLRAGVNPDNDYLAKIYYDVWNSTFLKLIREDECSLARHREDIAARFRPLTELLFDEGFLRAPVVRPERNPDASS
jgi:AcrR family transcriptional regulator